jgi:CheY-like chemotaxis protein
MGTTQRQVLIVEDNKETSDLISQQLTTKGYTVQQAFDGPTAIKKAVALRPDAVLLDIVIPGVSGYEVCMRLRRIAETAQIPIIFLTALNEVSDKSIGFAVGGDDYITKPHDVDELHIRLTAQINQARKRRALATTSPQRALAAGQDGVVKSAPLAPTRNPTVSVVIPALNEADCLPHVLPYVPDWVDEVLLVDGNSQDDTISVARRLLPSIRVISQKGRGKGDALRLGLHSAKGDIIVMLDADGSSDPSEIPAYVGALLAGADFAKGSRFLQGADTADMPFYRKMGNLAFIVVTRLLFGGRYSDLLYGYNALWKHALPRLDLDTDGFEIETQMNIQALVAGLKVAEVASFEAKRIGGDPKLRALPDGWRILKTVIREFILWKTRRRPPRVNNPTEQRLSIDLSPDQPSEA